MGLNVYFCDVCGVRVTDVDLRSGHGMLRVHDVICATCLDMGHGKEWLTSRGGEGTLVGAGLSLSAGLPQSAGGARNGHAHLLDHARDRAATIEDRQDVGDDGDEESSDTGINHEAVQRQLVLADEPQARQLDHEDTGLVDSVPADFSGAAAGFAALSQPPSRRESDDAHGDVEEDTASEVDPALLHETPPMELHPNEEHQASPFSAASADEDESSALINVNKSSNSSRSASPSSAGGKKGRNDSARKSASRITASSDRVVASSSSKSNSSNIKKSPSNSGSGKISKPKPGRSSRRTTTGMAIHLKIALFTVPLILLIAVVVVLGRGSGSAKQGDVNYLKNQQAQILKNFSESKNLVNDAWVSKDVAQMKAADARWKVFMQEWDQFSKDTIRLSGWTEDNCNAYWEDLKANDVYNRTRLLRDEIAKQTKH